MRVYVRGIAVAILLAAAFGTDAAAQKLHLTERNLLTSRYDPATVYDVLVAPGQWHPLPKIDERAAWEAIPQKAREAHIAAAESLMGSPWESLTAGLFLEFDRTGNRSNYQRIFFKRRERLATMVIAELLENKGRFIDDIADGVWLICEETFWGVPAHLDLQTAGFGLPDPEEPVVDLFAAETGALLSWTLYFMGDRLDDVSPLVTKRISLEVRRRILEPLRTRDDFWWMGFDPTVINNWTPWVGSNWLASLLIVETDPHARAFGVYKVLQTLDLFMNSYPDDGGCDEGPNYWNRAGGSLLDALEILHSATGGRISIYDEPLVQNMGRFIYRTYVGGSYFINFADAAPRVSPDPAVMLLFGKRIGDDRLMGFAGYFSRVERLGEGMTKDRFGSIMRQIRRLLAIDELRAVTPIQPLIADVWLSDTQVMAAREVEDSVEGFYLAAKAGHNGENHNHNDVGSFIVYESGRPVLIDVGPGTYTRTTFSSDRYTVWNFQSDYHNDPTINGVMQKEGREFAASEVTYDSSSRRSEIRMDLSGAYPDSAAVERWMRSIALNRDERAIEVSDEYTLTTLREPPRVNLITALPPEQIDSGRIRLSQQGYDDVLVVFDSTAAVAKIEPIDLDDEHLRAQWGARLFRIVLSARSDETIGRLGVTLIRRTREKRKPE